MNRKNFTVCMITQSAYPNDPRVRRQAEVLDQQGIETDILCLKLDGQTEVEKYNNITAIRILQDSRQEKMAFYILQSIKFFIKSFLKIQKLHKERKYSVIQVHNMPDFHVFAGLFQKIAGVPVVLDIHDLTPELFSSKWTGVKNRILRSVVEFAEQISCKFSAHVITVTQKCKDILVDRGVPAEKVSLILNTPNKNIFQFDSERNFDVINRNAKLLYHGTVAERFGLHLAIEAMPNILKKVPGSTLNIYGKYDASYKEHLENLIKTHSLQDNVFLNGRVSFEEVYQIIKQSDFGIVPYLNNEYMNLALSTKTFEYAASGLPVVATKLESLSLTFPDETIKYCSDEAEDIAEKVVELCFNADERKNRAYNSYKALDDISWDVMAARYLKLMKSLAGDKKAYAENNHYEKPEEALYK